MNSPARTPHVRAPIIYLYRDNPGFACGWAGRCHFPMKPVGNTAEAVIEKVAADMLVVKPEGFEAVIASFSG